MIYCIWYPSGGFGHFVNAVLALYGKNFARPKGTLNLSANGNSHNLDLTVPKYYHNFWPHKFEFDQNKNYSVLVDNGINDENTNFKTVFPNATVVKLCYTDYSWPIIAHTLIVKAMQSNIEQELTLGNDWDSNEDWAKREKYFLFLRDHALRHAWKPGQDKFIKIDHLLDYNNFCQQLSDFVQVSCFKETWTQWREANSVYIDPVELASTVVDCVQNRQSFDLRHVTDIWTQAVIYYFIWLKFGIEVPHNTFANWIESTDQIIEIL